MHVHSADRCLMRTFFATALLFSAVTLSAYSQSESQSRYKVLDHWKLTDSGGWDYLLVDSPAHRIYITRGDHVDAVDSKTGKLLGTISGLHGTHGVALNPDGKVGYISDGGGNAVVVFDRSNFSTVATIPAGTNPDCIIYEPATNSVWAFNGRSHDITVIDAASQKVVNCAYESRVPSQTMAVRSGTSRALSSSRMARFNMQFLLYFVL